MMSSRLEGRAIAPEALTPSLKISCFVVEGCLVQLKLSALLLDKQRQMFQFGATFSSLLGRNGAERLKAFLVEISSSAEGLKLKPLLLRL